MVGGKTDTRKIAEFNINLRRLKLLYEEKKNLLEPPESREYEEYIQKKNRKGFESGNDNNVLYTKVIYLMHLNTASLQKNSLEHEEVVDKVSEWFRAKGYNISKGEPFIINGLDIKPDVFLYKPGEWGGVECKGSKLKPNPSERERGLGQVLLYHESFNFAYLASSDSIILTETFRKIAKRVGFGILFVKEDGIEEIMEATKISATQAEFTRSSFEQKWRPENQNRVIAVLRYAGKVKKEHLAKRVAETYGISIEEASKAISELEKEKIIGLEEDDYVLLL